MVLAATLAIALVCASPAMANGLVVAGDVDGGLDTGAFVGGFGDDSSFVDASQQQFVLATSTGDANAGADDGSVAYAEQDLSVYQSQFNAGFDGDSDDDGIFDESDGVILAGDFDNDGFVDDFEF